MDSDKKHHWTWSDGETWTKTVFENGCKWVIVEFALKSGEIYPDPHLKMEARCVYWKTLEDWEDKPVRKEKCKKALRNSGDGAKDNFCQQAVDCVVKRIEDIVKYGETV